MITRLAIERAQQFTYMPWMLHCNPYMLAQLSPPLELIRTWSMNFPVEQREEFIAEQIETWEVEVAEVLPLEFVYEMDLLKQGIEPDMRLLPSEMMFGNLP